MGYYEQERTDPYQLKLKKGRFSKAMVVAITIALLLFTAATFVVALCGAYIPDALIYCFFGAALGEYWALAMVKKTKTERSEADGVYRDNEPDAEEDKFANGRGNGEPAEAGSADAGFASGRRI